MNSPDSETEAQQGAARSKGGNVKKYLFLMAFPLVLVSLMVGLYTSAMHAPTPTDLPVAVAGPTQQAQGLADRLNGQGDALDVRVVADADAAAEAVKDRDVAGAYVLPAEAGAQPVLYTAQAAGASQAAIVQQVFTQVAVQQDTQPKVEDVAPLPSWDGMGTTALYVTIGGALSGYLIVILLNTAAKELLPLRRLLPVLAGWSVLMSGVIWLITGPVVGAVHGHGAAVFGLGVLGILSTALVTTFLARLLGPLASLPAIVLFMFLGVPASNGALSIYTVPAFFQALYPVLPLGANVEMLRSVLYFGGHGVGEHVLVPVIWGGAALLLTVLVDLLKKRRNKDSFDGEADADLGAAVAEAQGVPAVEAQARPGTLVPSHGRDV